jgi:imidazole glycerol-phosphate synthase subunit HisF
MVQDFYRTFVVCRFTMLKKRIIPKIIVRPDSENMQGYSAYVSSGYNTFFRIGTLGSQLRILESNKVDELFIVNADKSEAPISDEFLAYVYESISYLRTPVTIGGGIESVNDAENLIASGADKLIIGINESRYPLINFLSRKFGAQAIVGSIDYSLKVGGLHGDGNVKEVYPSDHLISIALKAQSEGIGEILLNCIDNDGARNGFDLDTVFEFHEKLTVPVIASSGAGNADHFVMAFEAGADAVSAGTYFSKLDQSPLQLRSRLINKGVYLRK